MFRHSPQHAWFAARRGFRSLVGISGIGLVLVTSLLAGVPALASPPGPSGATTPSTTSAPVGTQRSRAPTPSATDGPGVTSVDQTILPAGGSAVVPASGPTVDAGGLPVSIAAPAASPDDRLLPGGRHTVRPPVSSVRVDVAGQSVARMAGVRGVVLSLSRVDGVVRTTGPGCGWCRCRPVRLPRRRSRIVRCRPTSARSTTRPRRRCRPTWRWLVVRRH